MKNWILEESEEDMDDLNDNDIDELIALYDGDVRALIKELVEERKMLITQIELASSAMSIGYTRGWKPNLPVDGKKI